MVPVGTSKPTPSREREEIGIASIRPVVIVLMSQAEEQLRLEAEVSKEVNRQVY